MRGPTLPVAVLVRFHLGKVGIPAYCHWRIVHAIFIARAGRVFNLLKFKGNVALPLAQQRNTAGAT